jgi:hypothetical protein
MQMTTRKNKSLTINDTSNITLNNGNFAQHVKVNMNITAKQSLSIISGNSLIKLTPSDITLQGKQLEFGNAAAPANKSFFNEVGSTMLQNAQEQQRENQAEISTIKHHPVDVAALAVGGILDETGVGEVVEEGAVEDIAANETSITSKDIEANKNLRKEYINSSREIKDKDLQLKNKGVSLKNRSYEAWKTRHDSRLIARNKMSDKKLVEKLKQRDLAKYGNPDGPTFDSLVKKQLSDGKTLEEAYNNIIESSQRTNVAVDNKFFKDGINEFDK